jgi:hypothetical protein
MFQGSSGRSRARLVAAASFMPKGRLAAFRWARASIATVMRTQRWRLAPLPIYLSAIPNQRFMFNIPTIAMLNLVPFVRLRRDHRSTQVVNVTGGRIG